MERTAKNMADRRAASARWRSRNLELARANSREYHREKHLDDKGKIYFIQAASGPVKIGYTRKKPEGRLIELQAGNHETLRVVKWFFGTHEDEAGLHSDFLSYLIRGEWYRPQVLELYKP